jgi:hypothetical protein
MDFTSVVEALSRDSALPILPEHHQTNDLPRTLLSTILNFSWCLGALVVSVK